MYCIELFKVQFTQIGESFESEDFSTYISSIQSPTH